MEARKRPGAGLSSSVMRLLGRARQHAPALEALSLVRPLAGVIRAGIRIVEAAAYRRWLQRVEPTSEQVDELKARTAGCAILISIVMPVYKPDPALLLEAVDSVRAQTHDHWQLVLCNDGSGDPVLLSLLDSIGASDGRIRVVQRNENGGISAATNDAIASSDGEFIAFMDQDDRLAPWALSFVIATLQKYPDARLLYSDEDKLDHRGRRIDPHFKPDWDPALLEANNYVCHLLVVCKAIVESVGGLRSRLDGAQDYDLVLRCTDLLAGDGIVHIPAILYHWRAIPGSTAASAAAKPYAHEAGRIALADHFGDRVAAIHDGPVPFSYVPQLRPQVKPASVSVALWGVRPPQEADNRQHGLGTTHWDPLEVLWTDWGFLDPPTLGSWISAVVEMAAGDLILFAASDLRVRSFSGFEQLVARLGSDGGVGAVGPKLFDEADRFDYPDVGIRTSDGGKIVHTHRFRRDASGYMARLQLPQSVSALNLACLLVRKCALVGLDAPQSLTDGQTMSRLIGTHLASRGLRCVYEPLVEVVSGGDFIAPFGNPTDAANASSPVHNNSNAYYPRALCRERADFSLATEAPSYLSWLTP
jgi:O-antigen biosynthesis protein